LTFFLLAPLFNQLVRQQQQQQSWVIRHFAASSSAAASGRRSLLQQKKRRKEEHKTERNKDDTGCNFADKWHRRPVISQSGPVAIDIWLSLVFSPLTFSPRPPNCGKPLTALVVALYIDCGNTS
jgi:hypothetical protein